MSRRLSADGEGHGNVRGIRVRARAVYRLGRALFHAKERIPFAFHVLPCVDPFLCFPELRTCDTALSAAKGTLFS